MPAFEPPTEGARRIAQNRRTLYVAAGVLLALAAATLAWALTGDNIGVLLIFGAFFCVGVFLLFFPLTTSLYIRDYDTRGYVRTPIAAAPAIAQIAVGVAMLGVQLLGRLDRNAIALMIVGAVFVVMGVVAFVSVLRARDTRAPSDEAGGTPS